MAIKLFVSDIDGTLLPGGSEISAKNIEAVQKMVEAGIIVTIATGRMYEATLPVAKKLGVNVPIITYNGALIKTVEGEVLHSEFLPEDIIPQIIDFFRENGWHLQTYVNGVVHFVEDNERAKFYEKAQGVAGVYVGWDGLKKNISGICKMLSVTSGDEETDKIISMVREKFGDKIKIMKSNPIFAEIVCPGVSKASALKILAKKLGVDRSEVMAIGDSDNDLEMLQAAGQSVAMGDGRESVKKICTYITGNCADDGFSEAVYKYVLGDKKNN